jgi:hypothetical protein
MRGLDPRIHLEAKEYLFTRWIAGSSPAMTPLLCDIVVQIAPFWIQR